MLFATSAQRRTVMPPAYSGLLLHVVVCPAIGYHMIATEMAGHANHGQDHRLG
jgi:hypothetical protein